MVMESVRRKFIEDEVKKALIMDFLEKELEHIWIADLHIQKSPIETRITIEMLDPRRLVSRRSRKIQHILSVLKKDFGIENPRINVVEVKNPYLEPRIVAKKAALSIERGGSVKGILYRLMKHIMSAGAMGVELIAAGKLGSKGSKARSIKVVSGFVPKAGDPSRFVKEYHYAAVTKPGIIGITVRIATKDLLRLVKPELFEKEAEEIENADEEEGTSGASGAAALKKAKATGARRKEQTEKGVKEPVKKDSVKKA